MQRLQRAAAVGIRRGKPSQFYDALASDVSSTIESSDAQLELLAKLDDLKHGLERYHRFLPRLPQGKFFGSVCGKLAPRGLYIHGGVGVGKSFCMDLFFESLVHSGIPSQRKHFHEFMLSFHEAMHKFKSEDARCDALEKVAWEIVEDTRVICFDEFQVGDIADAMVLKRLFEIFIQNGVVVVATSNRHPSDLYSGGLNRHLFLPFVDFLQKHSNVMQIQGDDYRTRGRHGSSSDRWRILPGKSEKELSRATADAISEWTGGSRFSTRTIPVALGREIELRCTSDGTAIAAFDELMSCPLGAADFLALTSEFHSLVLTDVPAMTSDHHNEARRFIVLVDALYESGCKFFATSSADIEQLFSDDLAEPLSSASMEQDDAEGRYEGKVSVSGHGGSSSSSSTTFFTNESGERVEWSATGISKASLASLHAVQDIAFSFARCRSRLMQMTASDGPDLPDGPDSVPSRELNVEACTVQRASTDDSKRAKDRAAKSKSSSINGTFSSNRERSKATSYGSPAEYVNECEERFGHYSVRMGIDALSSLQPVVSVDLEGIEGKKPVLLAQIADNSTVVLADFSKPSNRKKIIHFLQSREKVVVCDAAVESRFLGRNINYVDIQKLAGDVPKKSLRSLAAQHLGMKKQAKFPPSFYTYENWKLKNLDKVHKAYAASDAICTFQLFQALRP
eukprot:g4236.t1